MKTKPNGVSAYTVGRAATPAASTPAESNSRTKVSGTPVLAARGDAGMRRTHHRLRRHADGAREQRRRGRK